MGTRKIAPLLAALLMVAASSSAWASELDAGSTQRLQVHGDITQHCAISSPGNVDFGSLGSGGEQADLHFGLDCNFPFVMNVQAQYGALTNIQYPRGQGPYAGSLPYVLDFSIPARTPSATTINATLSSRDLIGGKSISSNGAIATEGMQVHVTPRSRGRRGRPPCRRLRGNGHDNDVIDLKPS